jgi:hypothetical protein
MFAHLSFLSTPFAVRAARPRKKYSAAKNYEFEKKKIAHFARGGGITTNVRCQSGRVSGVHRGKWSRLNVC